MIPKKRGTTKIYKLKVMLNGKGNATLIDTPRSHSPHGGLAKVGEKLSFIFLYAQRIIFYFLHERIKTKISFFF